MFDRPLVMKLDIEALRARNRARKQGDPSVLPCETDVDALIESLAAAQGEIHTLREQNADLEASAALWSNLYEKNVFRANEAEERSAVGGEPPAQRYVVALDVVEVLKEALQALLEDCPDCEGSRSFNSGHVQRCERCRRAVAALEAAQRSL